MILAQRLVGVALALSAILPVHRLLDPRDTGPAGAATRDVAEASWLLGVSGTLIVVTLAWVAMRMQPQTRTTGGVVRLPWDAVRGPTPGSFAILTGCVATLGSGILASRAHGRAPTTVDEMAQLLHAAIVADGRLTLPTGDAAAALVLQNGVLTHEGWVSIYPPLHTLLLAIGLTLGAAWLVGPILTGIATGASAWTLERLMGKGAGRLSGLLLCVSPFWLLVGGSHLSHSSAAAALALMSVACLRARDATMGRAGLAWAALAGAAMGMAVSSRPWIGLVCSVVIVLGVWGPEVAVRDRRCAWIPRFGAMAVGGLPFAMLLLGWNAVLFGHPLRLGYSATFGPSHGLGWHPDPWGNRYGFVEAIGYTGADLLQLGVRLLESPLPVTLLVALLLLMMPGVFAGRGRLPALWAGSIVAANALYWHHGIHFGPRMLYESVPAWMGLVGLAATSAFEAGDGSGRRFARWVVGMTLTAGIVLSLSTLAGIAGSVASDPLGENEAVTAMAAEDAVTPRVVFVHGSWASRVSARLAAAGMRRDSIETALRRNDLCRVDQFARWRASPIGPAPDLNFDPQPGSPAELQTRTLSPGNRIRVSADVEADATCMREARADRLGVLDLELVAWRAPALPDAKIRYVRDLGPGANLRVTAADPSSAVVWIDRADGGPLLLPYREGMQLLWGGPGD